MANLFIKNQLAKCEYDSNSKSEHLKCKDRVTRLYFPSPSGDNARLFCEKHIRWLVWIDMDPLYFAIKRIRR